MPMAASVCNVGCGISPPRLRVRLCSSSLAAIASSPPFPCFTLGFVAQLTPAGSGNVEFKRRVRHAALSDGAPEGREGVWCGLCGDRGGWLTCGRCMGEGGFPTRPGLAGVKGKVGWARCKMCFGERTVPCLFCGTSDVAEWKLWMEHARRHPRQGVKRTTTP